MTRSSRVILRDKKYTERCSRSQSQDSGHHHDLPLTFVSVSSLSDHAADVGTRTAHSPLKCIIPRTVRPGISARRPPVCPDRSDSIAGPRGSISPRRRLPSAGPFRRRGRLRPAFPPDGGKGIVPPILPPDAGGDSPSGSPPGRARINPRRTSSLDADKRGARRILPPGTGARRTAHMSSGFVSSGSTTRVSWKSIFTSAASIVLPCHCFWLQI